MTEKTILKKVEGIIDKNFIIEGGDVVMYSRKAAKEINDLYTKINNLKTKKKVS